MFKEIEKLHKIDKKKIDVTYGTLQFSYGLHPAVPITLYVFYTGGYWKLNIMNIPLDKPKIIPLFFYSSMLRYISLLFKIVLSLVAVTMNLCPSGLWSNCDLSFFFFPFHSRKWHLAMWTKQTFILEIFPPFFHTWTHQMVSLIQLCNMFPCDLKTPGSLRENKSLTTKQRFDG